jgi:predicted HTH transcriptional regulator
MMDKVVREVAGFFNSGGGNLFLGVDDSGTVVGIDDDLKTADPKKSNRDGYELFLRNVLSDKLKAENSQGCVFTFHEIEDKPVCRILVPAAPKPVYLDGSLIIRDGSSSRTLDAQQAASYIDRHW